MANKPLSLLAAIIFHLTINPLFGRMSNDPLLTTESLTSNVLCASHRCGGERDKDLNIFKHTPKTTSVQVKVRWDCDGKLGQVQRNEVFRTSLGIHCLPDPVDAISSVHCGQTVLCSFAAARYFINRVTVKVSYSFK